MDDLTATGYRPYALLNALTIKLQVTTDAALAQALSMTPPAISRIRSGKLPIGPSLLIRFNELTGWQIGNMRELMGLPHQMYINRE